MGPKNLKAVTITNTTSEAKDYLEISVDVARFVQRLQANHDVTDASCEIRVVNLHPRAYHHLLLKVLLRRKCLRWVLYSVSNGVWQSRRARTSPQYFFF